MQKGKWVGGKLCKRRHGAKTSIIYPQFGDRAAWTQHKEQPSDSLGVEDEMKAQKTCKSSELLWERERVRIHSRLAWMYLWLSCQQYGGEGSSFPLRPTGWLQVKPQTNSSAQTMFNRVLLPVVTQNRAAPKPSSTFCRVTCRLKTLAALSGTGYTGSGDAARLVSSASRLLAWLYLPASSLDPVGFPPEEPHAVSPAVTHLIVRNGRSLGARLALSWKLLVHHSRRRHHHHHHVQSSDPTTSLSPFLSGC